MSTLNFQLAVKDYRFLKERDYPVKAALKLVGDRYRLSALERNCLFRGVVEPLRAQTRLRKRLKARSLRGRSLGIDWFNVLITVESYLKGSLLFLADDGVVRDAAQVHGSYRPSTVSEQALRAIIHTLTELPLAQADVFIDSPISYSNRVRERLREEFKNLPFRFSLNLLASADYSLKSYAEVIASSDSVIIDQAPAFFDLAAETLFRSYGFRARPLEKIRIFPGSS